MTATLAPPAGATAPIKPLISVPEYLERERHSEIRHEYVEGELIPMPGTSLVHNQIAINLTILLDCAFRDRDCVVYMSDIRLRVSPTRYRYPDVIALCGTPQTDDETPPSLLNPAVIVEVLSPSSAEEDRGAKWEEYRQIPTLTDYLLIASDRLAVTHYARENVRRWTLTDYVAPDETLSLAALDATLSLTEIYRKVVFPAASEPASDTTQV